MAAEPQAEVSAELDRLAGDLPALGIAVSGGSDSVALLHMAHEWARARGVRIEAATVDHRLRPEAAAEAAQEIGELESDLDATREHLAAAQLALDNLHQSSSWRLTAPVRWSLAQAQRRGRPTPPTKGPGSPRGR